MKLQKLNCPNCDALLNMELTKESDYIFCPYCGQQFHIDNEKKEYTFNKNININKNINHTKRTINETEVEKAKASAKETKYMVILIAFMFVLMIGCFTIPGLIEELNAKKEEQVGKINIGSHYDYEEKNYEFVVAEFQALGFEDIDTIDLDDAGFFKNKADTVESVSVNGNSKFTWQDYFYVTDKVIITYH